MGTLLVIKSMDVKLSFLVTLSLIVQNQILTEALSILGDVHHIKSIKK